MITRIIGWRERKAVWALASSALLLAVWVIGSATVSAQEESLPQPSNSPEIKQLRIQVLPEFDDPRVLVIVQGRLDVPAEELPIVATFRVPQGAQINQMAVMDMMKGSTRSQAYEVTSDPEDDQWSLVSYQLDNAHFFYEYYYDPFVEQADKTFTFAVSNLYSVADLLVEIQEPLAATDFVVAPEPTITRFDEVIGFNYHRISIGEVAANQPTTIDIRYTKTDPAPSVSRQELNSMQKSDAIQAPSPQPVAEKVHDHILLFGKGLFAIGVILLVGLGAFRLYDNFAQRKENSVQNGTSEPRDKCTQCHTLLKENAHFCHQCGAPLKKGVSISSV